ncbi:MAG: hypothetical protein R2839_04680 [Thermomicrobiales bacterium]
MDLYLFGLKTAGAQSLDGVDGVRLINAPASTLSLILNPAPAPEGSFNPFSVREIRYAMQSLVDRDFIANDIYQGRALPMLTNISQLDYDQLDDISGRARPTSAMTPTSQTSRLARRWRPSSIPNGQWTFNDAPIMTAT